MDHHFQVDLRSIIELLSNNLYSGPQVFVRELLQNSVDAIRARQQADPTLQGRIDMELIRTPEGQRLLVVEDNGIGLTEEQVHLFLATIGGSSKREQVEARRGDYIGQFGIGILSCFIVTDEIVVVSRSITSDVAVEWRGRGDGSYAVRTLDAKVSAGTKIYLRANPTREAFFEFDHLATHARNYASLLPFAITLQEGERTTAINTVPPWRQNFADAKARDEGFRTFGSELLQADFFDFIPLQDKAIGLEGAAYVLAHSPSPVGKKAHRLYLKNILISEEADNVAPEWAFFVRCVINTEKLTPTASREAVCENEALTAVRDSISRQLREYILHLVRFDAARLKSFLALHALAIKHLALFDDEFLLLFIEHIPFETNFGVRTLMECRRHTDELFYVGDVDEFRQVSEISGAQGLHVINAGYVYDMDILERYSALKPERAIQKLTVTSFAARLKEISLAERNTFHELLTKSDRLLSPFRTRSAIRHFQPETLPVIYVASKEMLFRRSVADAKGNVDEEWSGILQNILESTGDTEPELCFNASNPLIQSLAREARTRTLTELKEIIELLYVQSLLLGRRSLRPQELAALNNGILRLAETHLAQS